MLKLGICDDETLYRNDIIGICKDYYKSDLLIQEFARGEDLLAFLKKDYLDIIFLDIEMGGKNGIEIKDYLEVTGVESYIIFITSHDEFVMRAFGKNVMGYIEKPVVRDKIYKVLDRIEMYNNQIQKIEIEDNYGNTELIRSDKIKYIQAEHVYTKLFLDNNKTVLVRKSMNEWEASLNEVAFYRIQKSYIINLAYVEKIEAFVRLEGDVSLKVGRGKIKALKGARREYMKKTARII